MVVPEAFVTAMSTTPAAWAGIVTLIWVSLEAYTPIALTPPKVTDDEPETVEKFLPVMRTETAPEVGPEVRDRLVITGRC